MNRKIYYNQADKRWANHRYPSPSLPNATIKSGGCGATSSAMIATSLTNNTVYPDQIGDVFVRNGIRVNGGTDTYKASKYLHDAYRLEYKLVKNDNELINHLANGYVAMVNVAGGSVFSTGGHIIFVCGYANGVLQVHDPYMYANKFNQYGRKGKVTVQKNDVYITTEKWKRYAKATVRHVFKIPEDASGQKYNIGQTVKVEVPINVAYDGGDWLIVDSNGYQFWVYNSLLNEKNDKLLCLAKIKSYNPITKTYQMVVFENSIYETRFDCIEKYMTEKY